MQRARKTFHKIGEAQHVVRGMVNTYGRQSHITKHHRAKKVVAGKRATQKRKRQQKAEDKAIEAEPTEKVRRTHAQLTGAWSRKNLEAVPEGELPSFQVDVSEQVLPAKREADE